MARRWGTHVVADRKGIAGEEVPKESEDDEELESCHDDR
jgi:hypothetical protein